MLLVWQSSIFWKLYAASVALILSTVLIASLILNHRVGRAELATLDDQLDTTAILLADIARPLLLHGPEQGRQGAIRELGRRVGIRLTVMDHRGRVLAESHERLQHMENHADRPEFQQALREGVGSSQRYSNTLQEMMRYRTRAIYQDERLVGVIRSALPLKEVEEQIDDVRIAVAVAALIAFLLALPLAAYFARRLTRRISPMTAVASALARGELEHRTEPSGKDEIATLGVAINSMAEQLADRLATITADRNQLQAILSSIEEGIVAVDRAQAVVLINEPAAQLFEISVADAYGQRIWEICRIAEVHQALSEALSAGSVVHAEARITEANHDRFIDLHATTIRTRDGESSGAVVVLHDISELRRLEAIRRDFVANVSHELKTPLAAIRGLVETMLEDNEQMPSDVRSRFLGKISGQGERLGNLVSDLLTLSRIESSDDSMEREHVELAEVLRRSHDGLLAAAEAKGIELDLQFAASVQVLGDSESLRQAVDNLCDNAIKYTPENGSVRLALHRDGNEAVISVADSGIGIAAAAQDRVFERFYRVDRARSRALGGTGLGLSIVKHVARSHGGSVGLQSQAGSGSTFTIRLPCI